MVNIVSQEKLIKKTYPVIYDGDCGFCQATVSFVKKFDWLNKFQFIPFQEQNVFKKYTHLTKENCEKEIYLIKGDVGDVKNYYGGYDAFKIMTLFLPVTFLISWFFFLPPVVQMGRMVYKMVAKNRHRIKLGDKVCKTEKNVNN